MDDMDHEGPCPVGPGGNARLVNQDEGEILENATAGMTVRTEGYQSPPAQR